MIQKRDSPFIAVSVGLHALLLTLAFTISPKPRLLKSVILSVETIPGQIPLGSGSGAEGNSRQITNTPPNPAVGPVGKDKQPKLADATSAAGRKSNIKVNRAPSKEDLEKIRSKFPIGVKPSRSGSDEPSEGGNGGDNRPAGTATGSPSISGPIGTRGYQYVDWGFPKDLPEESTLVLTIVVSPNGLVKSAQLTRNSGFPEIDQNAISKAKSMVFDPLPSNAEQVDMQGTLTFTFQYRH
jgi:TonB family protein